MRVGLSGPVFPGETVWAEMWGEEEMAIYRQIVGERVVVRDGVVELAGEGEKL